MPRDWIFYPDPQPTQQTRYVPIPKQGDQPPRQPPLGTVNALLIRQSWEPPDPMPVQKGPILPLTLVYGQQPPLGAFPYTVLENTVYAAWQPPDPMPAQRIPIVPLTLTYGQQPPPYSIVLPTLVRWTWEPPDPMPVQKGPVAPLTLTYGQQPPRYSIVVSAAIRQTWEPPDPQPQRLPPFVPIPAQGSQPVPRPWPNAIVAAWDPPWTGAQSAAPSAGWNFPPAVVNVPPPTSWVNRNVLVGSWVPPDPMPVQKPVAITPLTLTYGQQPAPAPLPNVIRLAWEPPWTGAQSAPPSAAWNVPPVVVTFVPYTRDAVALQSWQPPDPQPTQKTLYTPIPAQGQQPPPWSIVNVTAIRQVWEPPWTGAQVAAPAAPLTLTYGQQPPRRSWVTLYVTLAAWAPPDPQPARLLPIQIVSVLPVVTVVPVTVTVRVGRSVTVTVQHVSQAVAQVRVGRSVAASVRVKQ